MKRKRFSVWDVVCRDRDGNVKWVERGLKNLLHDEGEQWMLQVAFDELQSVPANFYIGLDDRAAIAEADNLAALTNEPSTNGYARQAVASNDTDWTISKVGDDYRATSKTVTFTASGGAWGAMKNMFLATSVDGSGKLVVSVALSATRTLQDGDSMNVSCYVSLGEA